MKELTRKEKVPTIVKQLEDKFKQDLTGSKTEVKELIIEAIKKGKAREAEAPGSNILKTDDVEVGGEQRRTKPEKKRKRKQDKEDGDSHEEPKAEKKKRKQDKEDGDSYEEPKSEKQKKKKKKSKDVNTEDVAETSTTTFGEKLCEQVEERLDSPRKNIDVMKSGMETISKGKEKNVKTADKLFSREELRSALTYILKEKVHAIVKQLGDKFKQDLTGSKTEVKGLIIEALKKGKAGEAEASGSNLLKRNQPTTMLRRPEIVKKTFALSSPNFVSDVNTTDKISQIEKELYFWLVHQKDQDPDQIVFADKKTTVRREEMMSLSFGTWIRTGVIDVWCIILNYKEKIRSSTSPHRFFATTYPCCYSIANAPKDWDLDRKRAQFSEKLSAELLTSGNQSIKKIDMFFFPIIQNVHYYVVCFDVRTYEACIIDNSASSDALDVESKYGMTPSLLQSLFSAYLAKEGMKAKSLGVKKARIVRLKMAWRDDTNTRDCGVYAMRHMETYMGGSLNSWDCGLEKGNATEMAFLRIRYCAAILTCEKNILRWGILNNANRVFATACTDRPLTVKDLLTGKW